MSLCHPAHKSRARLAVSELFGSVSNALLLGSAYAPMSRPVRVVVDGLAGGCALVARLARGEG